MMRFLIGLSTLPDSPDDLKLIAAINGGDSDAFSLLYTRYRDWVVSLAYRLTGDASIALDILQETFLYVLSKFPGFELRCRFKTFLYPVVRNLSMAAIKRSKRFHTEELDFDTLEAPTPQTVTHEATRAHLRAAMKVLSEAQRETLLLRYVDDLSLEEISQAQGIPLGTVKSRIHKSLELLKQDPGCQSFFLE